MKLLWLLPGQWFAFFFGLLLVTACKKEVLPLAVPVLGDSGAYVFPIVPGTPAWAAFTSGAAMVQACQVPPAVLQQMSTPGLVTTCLSYPLLGDMLAFISLQKGTRAQVANFNGFAELQKRPDAAQVLVIPHHASRPVRAISGSGEHQRTTSNLYKRGGNIWANARTGRCRDARKNLLVVRSLAYSYSLYML